jgi:hypothetical protein
MCFQSLFNQPDSRNTKNYVRLQATRVAKMYDDILGKFSNYYLHLAGVGHGQTMGGSWPAV